LNQVLDMLSRITGKTIQAKYDAPRSGDIRDSQADVSLARKILGYEPRVQFEEGLRRTWEWYKKSYAKS
jgi:nucleoside-diphosphate-sugar epimerase